MISFHSLQALQVQGKLFSPMILLLKIILYNISSFDIRSDAIHLIGLLNERIRSINNTLEKLEHGRYLYELKLSAIVGQNLVENCKEIIEDLKDTRHKKLLEWQKLIFERLWLK